MSRPTNQGLIEGADTSEEAELIRVANILISPSGVSILEDTNFEEERKV